MKFKALIVKWKVHNMLYGASGKPWRHISLKKALYTHNKQPRQRGKRLCLDVHDFSSLPFFGLLCGQW